MDPAWRIAGNELLFANSFKMKASVILGVAQMTLGIVLRGVNAVYFNEHVDFVCEFVPQILFNLSLFGYMVILIFTKWTIDWDVRMGLATCVTTDGRRELLLFDSSSDDLGGGGGFGFNSSDDSHTVTAGVAGGGGGGGLVARKTPRWMRTRARPKRTRKPRRSRSLGSRPRPSITRCRRRAIRRTRRPPSARSATAARATAANRPTSSRR